MKIAIITSPFCELPPDAIGAVEKLWFDLSLEFAKLGHCVQIIGKRAETILKSSETLKRTYIKGYKRTGIIIGDIFWDFFYSFRALRAMNKTDILVCNTFWSPVIGSLFFKRKYKQLVYNVARFPKFHMSLYEKVDCFACTSTPVMSELNRMFPSFRSRSVVVSNPINTSLYLRENRNSHIEALVGYHGRIHREKGLDILAKSICILNERGIGVKLLFIGSWDVARGGSGIEYKNELDQMTGGRIKWCGPISDAAKIVAELRECSVYCYPSVAEKGETFGVSPLEAMGLGLPTVVSALPCFRDFVEDGKNALIFDHRRPDAACELADLIERLLSDGKLRNAISISAANRAMQFSNKEIASRYIDLFEHLCNHRDCT